MEQGKRARNIRLLMLASASAILAISGNAHAQQSASDADEARADSGEIIVNARKRNETLINVPVTLTAVGSEELSFRAINNVDSLARIVPTLIVGEAGGGIQGGVVAIRGLAGADNNPLGDQAVSFNIDGVGIGRSTVRRMSDFDVQQIEVLKGPQALFFGKNSPAGIISIRTADPTDSFEAQVRTGYEFNAREWRSDAYVSGPLGGGFGIRLAGQFSDMKGWSRNYAPATAPAGLSNNIHPNGLQRAPDKTDYAARLTLKFDDGGPFTARLKMSYADLSGSSSTANTQYVVCPLGIPQSSAPAALGLPVDNCTADDLVGTADFSPNLHTFDADYPADGHTYLDQWQKLGSLEMNYDLSDQLTLTSVTGFYQARLRNFANFTQNFFEDTTTFSLPAVPGTGPVALNVPRQILASQSELKLREITQEVRLASNFTGPINFMLGGLYQDTEGSVFVTTARRTFDPIWVNKYAYVQDGKAWSIFGQATLRPMPGLELSGGVRYSHENKRLPLISSAVFSTGSNGVLAAGAVPNVRVPITNPNLIRELTFTNWSPEATISYKPNENMNIYASYKQGFLSGGFSALAPTTGIAYGGTIAGIAIQQPIYDQQTIKGFEVGLKTILFDRRLRLNIAAYTYKTDNLQVGVTTQGVQQEIRNAAGVRTKGVEADFSLRTAIEGLSFSGAVAYSDGRYLDYQASCYRGQSSTSCFNQVSRVSGQVALLQDLSGARLVRSPEWTGNLSFNYSRPLTSDIKLGLFGGMNFSSNYFADTTNTPGGLQPSYTLIDASLSLAQTDDRWEFMVIGRNLTNKYYFVRSTDTPFTGTAPGAAVVGIRADTAAVVNRGREIMLRVGFKFGG